MIKTKINKKCVYVDDPTITKCSECGKTTDCYNVAGFNKQLNEYLCWVCLLPVLVLLEDYKYDLKNCVNCKALLLSEKFYGEGSAPEVCEQCIVTAPIAPPLNRNTGKDGAN